MPEIGYLEAINQALHEEMERDKNVFMAGIDIAERGDVFGATQGLYSKYGKSRIMDTPIAENGIKLRRAALPEPRSVDLPHPGPEGGHAVLALRREGPDEGGDPGG